MFFMDLHERFPETFIVAEEDHDIVGYIMCRIEVGLSNFGLGGLIRKGTLSLWQLCPKASAKALRLRCLERPWRACAATRRSRFTLKCG
jgi:hypothetical protein